jgi:hypothetical protein
VILFWDVKNDAPVILGDNGEFYFYGEDNVAIEQGLESGRYWCKLKKMQDITPLNDLERHEVMCPSTGQWIPLAQTTEDLTEIIHRAALDPDWREVV